MSGPRDDAASRAPTVSDTRPGSDPATVGDRPQADASATWGERFERSTVGRVIISLGVLVVLSILFFWNLPDSELKSQGVDVVRPVAQAAGLDQNWRVFAPNPRRISLDLYAIAEYEDGSVATWRVPDETEPFLSPYRTYRWRKWMEHVRLDDKKSLWRPAAEWVSRELTVDGREPVRVSLIRRWYDIPAPGSGDEVPPWNEYTYFELDNT